LDTTCLASVLARARDPLPRKVFICSGIEFTHPTAVFTLVLATTVAADGKPSPWLGTRDLGADRGGSLLELGPLLLGPRCFTLRAQCCKPA